MEKYKFIIETIAVLLIIVIAFIINLDDIKKSFGSSDNILTSYQSVKDVIKIDINDTSIGIITDKDNKIISLVFFNDKSVIYYNKKIEKTNISKGIKKIIDISKENNLINDNTVITITKYKGNFNIKSIISKYCNNVKYNEESSTIEELKEEYNLTSNDEPAIIQELVILSKNLVRDTIKNKNKNYNYKDKTDYVYKKLEEYKNKNNISNEDINNHNLDIILIPVDSELTTYPTNNSYYSIKDNKIYAYIELNIDDKIYSYCYNGSIDNYKEGKC